MADTTSSELTICGWGYPVAGVVENVAVAVGAEEEIVGLALLAVTASGGPV